MEWMGKPNREAFEKVERYLAERHPPESDLIFADDRLDNLAAARARGWRTVWVRPQNYAAAPPGLGADHRIVDRITELDPEDL
jgi:FMN phosphatase YigB (HAD superfamily)